MVTKILDNYFANQFINYVIKDIRLRHFLDTEVERHKNGMIVIKAKPEHYKNYTTLLEFHRGDSLNHLISLRTIERDFVRERIKELQKNDGWKK